MKETYTLTAASQISGVSPEAIRAWERRYKAIKPKRLTNGRRTYSLSEVEKLTLLNKLTREGHSIGQIAGFNYEKLESIHKNHTPKTSHEAHPLTEKIIHHLNTFDLENIAEIIEEAKLTLDTRSFVLDFASPLMAEVGQKVDQQEMSIAQEHLISSILRSHFGSLLQMATSWKPKKRFLLTTPEGDFHEFGILLAAALCLSHGFGIHYLGPNLPAKEVIHAASLLKPEGIVLGTAQLPKELQKVALNDYIDEISRNIPSKTTFYIGGEGYRRKSASHKNIITLPTLHHFDQELGKSSRV